MTSREAKEVLLLFRPGRNDEADPQVAAALAQGQNDPELRRWFDEHCAFSQALQRKFGSLPVPRTLKGDILLGKNVVRGPAHWWSRHRTALAVAAAVVFFAIAASFWWQGKPQSSFADYRVRMVGSILREYRMDLFTNDMQQVRAFLQTKGAPSDYSVPAGLERTAVTGAGILSWHGEKVSMVCFDRGNKDMVFMFVSNKKNIGGTPRAPELQPVFDLATASWTAGDKVYLVAASGKPDQLRSYLP